MSDIRKSRKDQAEETKLHIFITALKLLDEMGFEKIKVRDIVRTAHVSIGTFYYYYASKLDVFYETYALADQYFEETVAPQLTQDTTRARLFFFFDQYALYCSDLTSVTLTSILFNSNNKYFDRNNTIGILRILPELISFGQNSGELATGDTPEETARFLMISVRGLVYDWCIHDG
ncbi:MAG: TetR/AcrR family transcriptional regulator, partial [Clostridiales bacterium]|nr:TetR/AcrR family transcriptional regulator [Clostridiales bacterium]